MAHHSPNPLSVTDLEAIFGGKRETLGPTGQFPQGKLTTEDEGEIRIAIGQKDGKVVIDFGKPTAWIGFTAEQAESIAETLREHATEIRLRR